jgi:hypothetical protein
MHSRRQPRPSGRRKRQSGRIAAGSQTPVVQLSAHLRTQGPRRARHQTPRPCKRALGRGSLNVSQSGTTSSWSVQNLPLTPFVSGKQAVDINLRDLGFSSGTNVASVDIHISIDSSIRTSEPVGPFTPFDVTDLDRLAWDNYDISGLFDPGEPTGIKLSSAPAPAGGLRAGRDLNVLQEDKSGCFPGSMARSLDWLNRSNGIGNPKTIEEIYSDLAALTGLPPNAPDRELRTLDSATNSSPAADKRKHGLRRHRQRIAQPGQAGGFGKAEKNADSPPAAAFGPAQAASSAHRPGARRLDPSN